MWWLLLIGHAYGLSIVSRSTADRNTDGYIDSIDLVFDAPVNDFVMDDAVRSFAFSITGYFFRTDLGWFTGGIVNDTTGYIVVDPGVSYDTGNQPGVKYDSTIVPGLTAESNFVPTLDRASPIVVNMSTVWSPTLCAVSQILFSESVYPSGLIDSFVISSPNSALFPGCYCEAGPSDQLRFISVTPYNNFFSSPKLLTTVINTDITDTTCDYVKFTFNGTGRNSTGFVQDYSGNPLLTSLISLYGPWRSNTTTPVFVVTAGSIDTDQNGYIDGYRVEFNVPMADYGLGISQWFLNNWVPTPDDLLRVSQSTCDGPISRVNTDQFWCQRALEDTSHYDTDLTGLWVMGTPPTNEATGWMGLGLLYQSPLRYGFLMDGNGDLQDWASPVWIQTETFDTHSTGYIDVVRLSFTEAILKNSTVGMDWIAQGLTNVLSLRPSFNQSSSQLVFQLLPIAQVLNTRVPVIEYNRYRPTFADLHGNFIERRLPLLFEVPVLQSALGAINSTFVTLHFTYNATNITVNDIAVFPNNSVVTILSQYGRDIVIQLRYNLSLPSNVSIHNTVVPITPYVATVYINQNQTATDILPFALLPTVANVTTGCNWNGSINALLIVNGILSSFDFANTFQFFQTRVNNQIYS